MAADIELARAPKGCIPPAYVATNDKVIASSSTTTPSAPPWPAFNAKNADRGDRAGS